MPPSKNDFAKASKGSYSFNKKGSVAKRTEMAQADAPIGYTLRPDKTNKNITTYQKDGDFIIAHRGTDLGSKNASKDLLSDFSLLFGTTNRDKSFNSRRTKTENIVRSLKLENPTSQIYLSGHSIGGSTSTESFRRSKYLRENVSGVETFNIGSSPFFGSKKKGKIDGLMREKVTHNVISGDGISEQVGARFSGKVETVEQPSDNDFVSKIAKRTIEPLLNTIPLGGFIFDGIDNLNKTLKYHSIDNFL